MALIETGNSLGDIRDRINAALVPFASREEFATTSIAAAVEMVHVRLNDAVHQLVPDPAGDWISADGRIWRLVSGDLTKAELPDFIAAANKNGTRVFPSRAAAVAAGQAGVPEGIDLMITIEGNALVFRARSATAPDPLFAAAPRWGETLRLDLQGDLDSLAQSLTDIRSGNTVSEDGVVLIAYRNGRAALVQRLDGLDFVPSDSLCERILGDVPDQAAATAEAVDGITAERQAMGGASVLIAYRNGRAALLQRPDGLDFVPSDMLVAKVTGDISAAPATAGGVPLVVFKNGRVAIMQKNDGLDFIPSEDFLARLPIQIPDPLSATAIQLNGVNGQSHSIGGPWDIVMTLAVAMGFVNRSCLQLTGTVRTDGAAITNSMGPGQYGYNTGVAATGMENAAPGTQQIGLPFAAFALLNAHRADLDLPQIPALTGAHGIGGIPLDQMDDDPATGDTTSTTVWTSFTYWNAQAKARAEAAGREILPGWHVFNHGGAGKYMLRGAYRAQWLDLQKDCHAYWRSIGLPVPRYIMTQTGGEADTTNDGPGSWAVAEDQLDIVEMGCAVLGTPDYWYPIWDNQVHWDAHGTALAGETLSWGMAEVEAGRRWSIIRPRVLSNAGGVLTLSFDSLREDESLEVEDASKYGGEGIDTFLGFQIVGGGAISAVDVTGRRVMLTYTGAATAVKYARQVQNVSTFAGNKYPAHRGLLRTSLRKRSKFFPTEYLVRAIPSFTLEL